MEEQKTDVKQEEATPTPIQEETTQTEEASEGVKTPEVIDRNVYEKVREAMKSEREAKKAEQAKNAELEERIAQLEASRSTDNTYSEDYDPYKAKTDILFLMNKDPFVKDNLDLIEEKMTANPQMDVQTAIDKVKADFFNRIQQEVSEVEPNKPLKQEKTTAIQEEVPERRSGDLIEDALAGKLENVPLEQVEAIKRVLKR